MTREELRQTAAIAAMQGMITAVAGSPLILENWARSAGRDGKSVSELICIYSVDYADNLIKALDNEEQRLA